MLPAPFTYLLSPLPACFHAPVPLRQMPLMIYPLQAPLHCVSPPQKSLSRCKQCHVLFESTWHFIELYCIFSHSLFLCKPPRHLTFTRIPCAPVKSKQFKTRAQNVSSRASTPGDIACFGCRLMPPYASNTRKPRSSLTLSISFARLRAADQAHPFIDWPRGKPQGRPPLPRPLSASARGRGRDRPRP